ncbi:hypothetical protein [Neobacillus sp.]|uniref:hypothetical protein n=1 Tax=Neobacillus sp. TaxID=2675273 RepID=UPI002899B37F|nr:hypothetical protein [Neobacillus sp.]
MSNEIPMLCEESFTVCLTANYMVEQIAIEKVMVELLSKSESGILNLALLKYSTSKLEDFLKKVSASNEILSANLYRINIYQPTQLNLNVILDEADLNSEENMLIIFGAERLSQFDSTPSIEKTYGELKIKLYSPDQVNIETGMEKVIEINNLLDHSISNLVAIFETSSNMAKQIFAKYKDDKNVELNIMIPAESDSNDISLNEILKIIDAMQLNESLSFIERQENFPTEWKKTLRFTSYLKNGYKEEALNLLKSDYTSLNNSLKLIYADLLNSGKHYAESYQILKELYLEDKWMPGLTSSFITSSRVLDTDERKKLIEDILTMNVKDAFLLQESANFYNRIKEYDKSGKLFREILKLTGNKYFELLARTAELQSNPPSNGQDAEGYLLSIAVEEPDLQNEVYYRSALIWKFLYKSMYKFSENLFKIKLSHTFNQSYEVINEKMDILANYHNVEKALKLKPLAKERDNDVLLSKRIDLIVDEIEFIFLKDNGHNLLRGFIDDVQSKDAWKTSIVRRLRNEISDWNKADLEGMQDSVDKYTENDLSETNSINAVRLIRKYKTKKAYSKEDIINIISGALILAEQEKNKRNDLWLRFEASTWFSYLGYYQDANNHALTTLNYYNRIIDNDNLRDLSFALGIAAWGDSQYRLGREIEGVICAIATIKKGIFLKNYYLIDKGLTIIHLWISNNDIFGLEDRKKLNEFYEKFSRVAGEDSKLVEIQGLMLKKEWEKAYDLLKPFVLVDENQENENWGIHFSNYITVCIQSGNRDEAVQLLYNKAKKAARLLEVRMDIRWKNMLTWSQILLTREDSQYNLLEILLINKDLLKIAIGDIEQQRNSVFHREERANLSDKTNLLFRTYVETLAILNKLKETPADVKKDLEKEAILNLIKIAPRTITEKRLYEGEVSEDAEKKFNNYLMLYDELMTIEADIESTEYKQKTQKFSSLQKELLEIHPYLKSLPVIQVNDLSQIQEKLQENEIFYQYCLTPMGMVYLLITGKELEFGHAFFDSQRFKKIANQFGETFSQNMDVKNIKEIEALCENVSEPIFHPIFNQKYVERISNLFICPDMSIPYFSTSLIRYKKEWFITSLDGIYNLLSVTNLLDRRQNEGRQDSYNILTIGSRKPKRDGAIPLAENWGERNKKYFKEIVNDFGEDNRLVIDILKKEKPNLYVMIAHGVEEPDISGNNGAFSILGPDKRYLSVNDIEDISLHTKNMFLITCRSGQPYSDNIQSSNSVWTSILSQKNNSILCRWDVDIRPSLILLEHIVSNGDKPVCHLLCEAQKKLLKSDDWNAPSSWAGYEYWGI